MSDETTTPEVEPADTPVEGTGTPQEENWKERYDNLQADHTRAAQEAAQLRQWQEQIRTDPDAQRQLLAELGYDVADDTPAPPADDDPIASLRAEYDQRLAAIEQQNQQAMTNLEIASHEQHVGRELSEIAAAQGGQLSEKYQDAVIRLGYQMRDDNGLPQLKAAAELLNGVSEEQMQQSAKSKPRPTHRVSQSGGAGEAVPDRATHQGRVELMLSHMQDDA